MSQQKIKGYECRFATYTKSKDSDDDAHIIKEIIHYEDGSTKPNIRIKENLPRKYWTTKPGFRNHQDKKEYEKLEYLDEHICTQSKLIASVARSIGKPTFRGSMRQLQDSPYIYGTDISSTALVKQRYKELYKLSTPYSYSAFDTECDVVNKETFNEIIIATIAFEKEVYTYTLERFVKGYTNVVEEVNRIAREVMGHVIDERGIKLNLKVVATEIDIVKEIFKVAHEKKPDFIGIWNLPFDIGRILDACKKAKVDPEDLFSDPSVPKKYRFFKFIEGKASKTSASNKRFNFKPAHRWHTVLSPSSFYFTDAMCVLRHVRAGQAEEPSYKLDSILKKYTKVKKLEFEMAKHLTGTAQHQFMQTKYPLHYIVYNMFDSINMIILDDEIKDHAIQLPIFADISDFQNFNSNPKLTVDAMHPFALQHGWVMGSTSSDMTDDFDDETVELSGWIVMLPSNMVADNGLELIKQNPIFKTNIRAHVADLDVSSSYPRGEVVYNISKRTTSKEIIDIEGVSDHDQRMSTINFTCGASNAVEVGTTLFKLPTLSELSDAWDRDIK